MRAADDANGGRQSGRRRDFRRDRPQGLPRAAERRHEPSPAEPADHRGNPAFARAPEIGMRADGRDLHRLHAAQAPGPILRIGEKGRRLRESLREHALRIEGHAPRVEPARHFARQRLLERRAQRIIFGVDRREAVELIIHRRQRQPLVGRQRAGGAVGRDGNDLDREIGRDALQRAHEKGPGAFRVEPQIGPGRIRGQRRVRLVGLGQNLAGAVEDDELPVGLAEIENGDAAGHRREASPAPGP